MNDLREVGGFILEGGIDREKTATEKARDCGTKRLRDYGTGGGAPNLYGGWCGSR